MLGAMEIRQATASDWPSMWPFMRSIIAAGETYAWDRDMPEERLRSYWLHPSPGRTLVAVLDGVVAGTAEFHPNYGEPGAHVANAGFMIDPAYAGRGVGRALGEYVLAAARDEGFLAMQFNAVVSSNVHAVALWKSLGFEIVGTIPDAFRHPELGFVGLHVMYRTL
jgi:GNAT superfamily N-acetyltransferase